MPKRDAPAAGVAGAGLLGIEQMDWLDGLMVQATCHGDAADDLQRSLSAMARLANAKAQEGS